MEKARIIVDSRARVQITEGAGRVLPEDVEDELRSKFEHPNPEFDKKQRFGMWLGDTPRWLRTWREEDRQASTWLSLPRGGLKRVRQVLKDNRVGWEILDKREVGDPELTGQIPAHRFPDGSQPAPFQLAAVDAVMLRQNCLVRAPTASGKTSIGLMAAARANLPTLVEVWSKELLKEWAERCKTELGIEAGIVQGPGSRVRPVTIAMQPTLAAHPEWIAENAWRFGMVICDEVQGFAAPTLFDAVDPFPAKYRLGISADETRPDGMEQLIYDLFGEVVADIDPAELQASGFIHDVQIVAVPTNFRASWYREKLRPKPQDFKKLLDEMVNNEARTMLAVELAARCASGDHRVICWSARVDHCRKIDRLLTTRFAIKSGLLLGGQDHRLAFDRTRDGLRAGTTQVGVGTVGGRAPSGTGMNVPALDRGVLTTPLASKRQPFNQARGRLGRVDRSPTASKRDAVLYYLLDVHALGVSHLKNLVKWYGASVFVLVDDELVPAREWLRHNQDGYARGPRTDKLEGIFE